MDHFCSPSLDALHKVYASPALTPHLDAVLQVRPYQCRVEGQDHLPQPTGHISFDCSPGYGWLSGLRGHITGSCPASHPPAPPGLFRQGCAQSFQISFQFGEKDVVGYHVKGLTEIQVDDIGGSSLVHCPFIQDQKSWGVSLGMTFHLCTANHLQNTISFSNSALFFFSNLDGIFWSQLKTSRQFEGGKWWKFCSRCLSALTFQFHPTCASFHDQHHLPIAHGPCCSHHPQPHSSWAMAFGSRCNTSCISEVLQWQHCR